MHLTFRHFDLKLSGTDEAVVNRVIDTTDVSKALTKQLGLPVSITLIPPDASVVLSDVLDIFPARSGTNGVPWGFDPSYEASGSINVVDNLCVTMLGRASGATPCLLPLRGAWSPLAGKTHLVVRVAPLEDAAGQDWRLKRAVAEWIHQWVQHLTKSQVPVQSESWEWGQSVADPLPRVVYVYQVQSQGPMRRTYLYGLPCDDQWPLFLSPLAVLGGVMISGNYVLCGQRNATIFHAENPIIRNLLEQHGRTVDFRGVILMTAAGSEAAKRRMAEMVAALARQLQAEGAVVSKEGGGNATVDLMLAIESLEQAGVKTVGLVNEMAGQAGERSPLIIHVPEADALVSTGNVEQTITLPEGMAVLGGLDSTDHLSTLSIPLASVHGSTNPLGVGRWGCREA